VATRPGGAFERELPADQHEHEQGPQSAQSDSAQGDEDSLIDAVATVGPIAVGVDANTKWQLYHGGIMSGGGCGGLAKTREGASCRLSKRMLSCMCSWTA